MRISSNASQRAGMTRCRLHAMLHTAAGEQDPKKLMLHCSYYSSQEQLPTLTFRDSPSYKCLVQAKAMNIWGLCVAPTNKP